MIDRDVLLKALAAKAARHADVTAQLYLPEVHADHDRQRVLSVEERRLRPSAEIHAAVAQSLAELADAREFLDDDEMRDLAQADIERLEADLAGLWDDAEKVLADDDELADRNVILEIRAGVGGDEAALFAGDLFTMYTHFCEKNGLGIEVLDENAGEQGGFKELVARVKGEGAYRKLRYESGGHRVQRVPKTESQGRIHTSAATVAVLPEAEAVDVTIDWDKDVREDKMRAGGPGGQSVNKTESAIRLTHLETGLTVHMQDEKSQHKNRDKARRILASRLFDQLTRERDQARAAKRKGMIGSGDRSQRVRTYNYPQNRVTDHRLEWSLHDLEGVLLGRLEEFHERLGIADREARLEALAEELTGGE